MQVVEVDLGLDLVGDAGHHHHTGVIHRQKVVQQQPGEREVTEVVGAELQLEPVGGRRLGRVHHAGVVDQQVDARVGGGEFDSRRAHRGQRAEVQFVHGDVSARGQFPDAGGRLLALGGVADRQHHPGAVGGEDSRVVIAETGIGAGDDSQSAALVGNVFLSPSHG